MRLRCKLYVDIFIIPYLNYLDMQKNIEFKIPDIDRSLFISNDFKNKNLIDNNIKRFNLYKNESINGVNFLTLREKARNEIIQIAIKYTENIFQGKKSTFKFNSDVNSSFVIATGHAPSFYHPGVWIKNYLVSHLSEKKNGIGLNVVMDNDTPLEKTIAIPDLRKEFASTNRIEFIRNEKGLAFEEIERIETDNISPVFSENEKSFHVRIKEKCDIGLANQKALPVAKYMNLIKEGEEFSKNVGESLTFARKQFETDFGIKNFEIPISQIAETEGFNLFFLSIVFDHCRFIDIYNKKLERFRIAKKIRSKANPLPNLKIVGDLYELPFWVWKTSCPREPLYVRKTDDVKTELISKDLKCIGVISSSDTNQNNLDVLKSIANSGYKIRPKAVTNTIFLRLFLSDIFIHGIGGAKYDLITDEIIKSFFNIEPPDYITISATLYPPFSCYKVKEDELQTLESDLKKMKHNPDKYIPESLSQNRDIRDLVLEKYKIIEGDFLEGKREKFKRIKDINVDLCSRIHQSFKEKELAIEAIRNKLSHNKVVNCRSSPIFIYPEDYIKEFYRTILSVGA